MFYPWGLTEYIKKQHEADGSCHLAGSKKKGRLGKFKNLTQLPTSKLDFCGTVETIAAGGSATTRCCLLPLQCILTYSINCPERQLATNLSRSRADRKFPILFPSRWGLIGLT